MPEENPETVPNPSRRKFLKRAGQLGLGAALTVAAGTLLKEPKATIPIPKELPPDVLTEEQLHQANIKVYNTPNVKLHLRQRVFDFPLFRDAKNHKIKGLTITLVDNNSVNWAISENFPKDTRYIFQHWYGKPIGQDLTSDYYLGVHLDTRDLKRKSPEIFTQHPELEDRVFIYLAVGKEQKPHPKESFLSPGDIKKYELSEKDRVAWAQDLGREPKEFYRFLDPNQASFLLRHELSHYGGQKIDPNTEYVADTLAFNSLVDAWEKLNHSGDISGYPFVFETDEGLTYAKRNLKPQQIISQT